jgi:5-methylcytosine-specific restriction endonuclease McrBC regulatory subunit McrC
MGHLAPDMALHGPGRVVWVDAKYKAHLELLARYGWTGLGEPTRDAHRADLHQALAYASLVPDDRVDTILVYPQLGEDKHRRQLAVSTLGQGRRRIRLVLGGLPFGFRGPAQREEARSRWREALAA